MEQTTAILSSLSGFHFAQVCFNHFPIKFLHAPSTCPLPITRPSHNLTVYSFFSSVSAMPFFLLAFRTVRRLLFFVFVDLLLEQMFERLPNEFSSLLYGEGFGVIEDLTVGCVWGGDFHVIEVSGGLFEKHVAGGLFGAFLAGSHSKSFQVRENEFTNFTYPSQSRNWGLTHPGWTVKGKKRTGKMSPTGKVSVQSDIRALYPANGGSARGSGRFFQAHERLYKRKKPET
jgi:hypothetical protein